MSNPTPDELRVAINACLDNVLGFHGPWVLGVECMDTDSGELQAAIVGSDEGAAWSRLGLAHLLVADITAACQQEEP